MNILIGDDAYSETIRSALDTYQPDWNLSITNSGQQCLEIIKNGNCPDIIILGINLTDMNGLDLVKLIREDYAIPIILLDNGKNTDILVRAFETGADEYVSKPFNQAIFVAQIKAIIRRREWDIQVESNQRQKNKLT